MIEWITQNWGSVWLIITSVITIASIIVKATPTQKDDKFLGKLLKFIEFLSVSVRNKKK